MNLLCRFAHRFPLLVAEILDRDRHKTRNFREETITDILMAGLVPFEPFEISTNYPVDESLTGEDMDWEFVNEHAVDGRKYLRLHIQAKRAKKIATKKSHYWLYESLDHALSYKVGQNEFGPPSPKFYGAQHKFLIDEASTIRGCVPLYMFYHPLSALAGASGVIPAVEGVNWIFAEIIPQNVGKKCWPRASKRLDKWRQYFHPLSELLCFGRGADLIAMSGPDDGATLYFLGPQSSLATPSEVANRLNLLRQSDEKTVGKHDLQPIEAVEDIPQETLAMIRATQAGRRKAEIKRPRVIFVSS